MERAAGISVNQAAGKKTGLYRLHKKGDNIAYR
jgi:hypothetical protein